MNPKVTMGLRVLFGIFCIVFGVNKFAGFLEFPPIPGDGGTLMGIYFTSGFLKIIGVLEIVFGLLLALGKYIPISLTILVAIMFNAFLFHVLHDTANIAGAVVGLLLGLVLTYLYKGRFGTFFNA